VAAIGWLFIPAADTVDGADLLVTDGITCG